MEQEGDKHRDTIVLTAAGDGRKFRPFLIKSMAANASATSGRKPPAGETPSKGMTKERMMQYVDDLVLQLKEQSVLIMDRLSSHTSKIVLDYIKTRTLPDGTPALTPLLLPAKTAFLISPLDMGIISEYKSRFYKRDRSSLALKFQSAKAVWRAIPKDHIINYFQNCHLIGSDSISSIRTHLLSQVQSGVPEDLEIIQDFYDGWKSGAFAVEGVSARRVHDLQKPKQLQEAELDGIYWRNWGPHGKPM